MFRVYAILNTATDMLYIGFTGMSVERRFGKHLSDARKGVGWALHAAIRQYSENSFTVQCVCTVETRAQAASIEQQLIVQCNTKIPYGYNMTNGGDGAHGYKHTDEWKNELRQRRIGKKLSPESIERMRRKLKGTKHSDEFKLACAERSRNRKHSVETRDKMRSAALNRWKTNPRITSPEEAERLRTLTLGRTPTVAHKAAIARALKGMKRSPESVAKMRMAARLREQRKREEKAINAAMADL